MAILFKTVKDLSKMAIKNQHKVKISIISK